MEKIQALLVNAAKLLQDLTADKVKASELKKCAGVAFVFSYKAGLIVSFQHGQGFLLRKLGGQPGACMQWSSPLFFTVNAAGAGATLGASEIASVVVLDTPEACDAFLRTQVMLDAELGAAAGSHGGQVDVMAANVTCPRESFHSFSYSRVSRGLMVDVSWNGVGVRVDKDANELLYGEGTSPAAILHGDVAHPQNLMAPLLKVLAGVLSRTSPAAAIARQAAPGTGSPKCYPGKATPHSPVGAAKRAAAAPTAHLVARPAVHPAAPAAALGAPPPRPPAEETCAAAARVTAVAPGAGAGVDAPHMRRCLLSNGHAAVKEPAAVKDEVPDVVAQLRALSPFAALSHIPIADA